MNLFIKILISLFIVGIVNSSVVTAQNKYGADSTNCIKNLSLYKEYYKHKNYKEAKAFWNQVTLICPKAHKSIYIDGAKMYRYFIKTEKDSTKQQLLLDTLLNIYNARILNFGQKGFVNGRMGQDLLKYRESETDTAYQLLLNSVVTQKNKSEAATLVGLMNASSNLFKNKKIKKETLLKNYFTSKQILESKISKGGKSIVINEKALARINKIGNKYLNCDDLLEICIASYNKDSSNFSEVFTTLTKANCTQSDFYLKLLEKQAKQYPDSVKLNYNLAGVYLSKSNYNLAIKYYNNSLNAYKKNPKINLELKSNIYYGLAQSYQGAGNYSSARKNALEAAEANPKNGLPYILIGDLYKSTNSCGNNDFENKAVYWIAVDMYKKAKSIDFSTTNIAATKIASVSKLFPDKETAFFNGYNAGQYFKIACWINETTTVKIR